MTFLRVIAALSLAAAVLPSLAASEDDVYSARQHLRCAAFYVFGSTGVTRPDLKEQLQNLANRNLYSAEFLMDKNRPLVKAEFDSAREKFLAEIDTQEVKADTRGFLQYMGDYCARLKQQSLPRSSAPQAEAGGAEPD